MMRKIIRWAAAAQRAAVFAIFSCSTLFAADEPSSKVPLNQRVYVAGRVYASLSEFAHWQNVPNIDVDAAYRAYLEKAIASEDRTAFSLASMEFLAAFKNSHTLFIDMALAQKGGVLPFIAQSIHGQWVVTESMSPGLNAGDVIEAMDGRPFAKFVEDSSRACGPASQLTGGKPGIASSCAVESMSQSAIPRSWRPDWISWIFRPSCFTRLATRCTPCARQAVAHGVLDRDGPWR